MRDIEVGVRRSSSDGGFLSLLRRSCTHGLVMKRRMLIIAAVIAGVVIVGVATTVLLAMFVPSVRQFGLRLMIRSEEITIPRDVSLQSSQASERSVTLWNVLGFDGISAILEPSFVTAAEAEAWMDVDEQVLGLPRDWEIHHRGRFYVTSRWLDGHA